MKVTALVVGKESFVSKGRNYYKLVLVVIDCPTLEVLVGKTIEKLVELDIYNMVVKDAFSAVDFEIDLKQAYKPEYASLHLDVDILGLAEEEAEPVPEETGTKPEHPAEPVKPADKHKSDTGGKEEK